MKALTRSPQCDRALILLWLCGLCAVFIFNLFPPAGFINSANSQMAQFGFYGLLALFPAVFRIDGLWLVKIIGIMLTVSLLGELLQSLQNSPSASFYDILAAATGIICGLLCGWFVHSGWKDEPLLAENNDPLLF